MTKPCMFGHTNCSNKTVEAVGVGIGIGFIVFPALLVLVLYIMGRLYNVSLGEIFGQIRDGFRDSKPKLQ
ncbi:hypothetical protein BBBOND_0308880 [Babesia bigemina]|uniref:Uncharacterized protein n=1 Tax=Babesia bigemina TaxID=5866 RepID=A0A061DEA9_BABBI|nr:hypothetical protein BBBOND_0308880 [Babesia bigemina]CDR96985.1 hypothetical protein BBBOND_0308880 [Babesia bigemina]|eukprot:XP_012769171.1 hypothetical protein BBBOND_0308880 [Babesia bigemina]